MTDPYVTYDTFSLGSDPEAASADSAPRAESEQPAIFARLPRLQPTPPKPKTRQRFDQAESPLGSIHLGETGPLPAAPTSSETWPLVGFDPVATIRIDTVTPSTVEAPDGTPKPAATRADQGAPATIPFRPAEDTADKPAEPALFEPVSDEPWSTTLLELESSIQPYSRWIALAALIAAMGLTIVILRSGGRAADIETAPPTQSVSDTTTFADRQLAEDPSSEGIAWASVEPIATEAGDAVLRPVDEPTSTVAPAPPAAIAAGPASASRGMGHARLTGEVLEPQQPRIEVADATNGAAYPETRR